ncbi:hypothetical protein B0T26DRAFT_813701 [Lasiosphaeria miniovina]|uniref:Aminoglycoside phosphotransferase domain-containing protein n=1 Tax=Lasiosphaeria miniovina TaxID=1954250 RepID=A0AA40DW47_9PEZI|nr:uncharacterized protein B0T26DRAFT_813701 [Lasiosphaeria miniovina]KAK0713928.1 hypothetical protein B0T26DRAFT_813701 [Lasiosphaeria miniovina]
MAWPDEWLTMPNGEPYDGKDLLNLVHSGKSPFDGTWDVKLLVYETEDELKTRCSNKPDIVARLARGDVNMPGFGGFPNHVQAPELLLLEQLARVRAALFRYDPPRDFAAEYLLERLFKFIPGSLSISVAPTREFWMHMLECKINATIQDKGDMIVWEDDEETSLLRAIPHILPQDTTAIAGVPDSLYRLVLEHGDFGVHNTTITTSGRGDGEPLVTSLFDWETACICPALLFDPLVAVSPVDLIVDENGQPAQLYHHASDYDTVMRAGRDFRHLWFALRDWRGGNSEAFFGGWEHGPRIG